MYVGDGDDVLYDVRLKEQIKNGDDVGSKVARGVGTVVGGVGKVFGESSQARALKAIKKEDPTFSTKVFLNELERVVIPTVLKAYSAGDMATLRQFTTGNGGDDVQMSSLEKAYADLVGNLKELEAMGLHVEGNILDIREVDVRWVVYVVVMVRYPVVVSIMVVLSLSRHLSHNKRQWPRITRVMLSKVLR